MTFANKQHSLARELFMGFCLGTANIIPGVSGGTFLLIFNIYERVFGILGQINRSMGIRGIKCLGNLLKSRGKKGSTQELAALIEETDALFLMKLILGALTAIFALSTLMKYLLVNHFSLTYAFFFGLILVSIVIPVKLIQSWKASVLFFVVLGMGATLSVSWLVNPYDKVKLKSDHLEQLFFDSTGEQTGQKASLSSRPFAFTGKYTLQEYGYAGVCGAVSVSAMILPGISGSLVLILMGAYFDVISALSTLHQGQLDTIAFLGCFGAGVVGGGLLFARAISFVLKRYYTATMGFLLGLMAGSLHALWPFKKVMVLARHYVKEQGTIEIIENSKVYTNIPALPANFHQAGLALVFFLAGCGVMAAFIRTENSKT